VEREANVNPSKPRPAFRQSSSVRADHLARRTSDRHSIGERRKRACQRRQWLARLQSRDGVFHSKTCTSNWVVSSGSRWARRAN